MTRTEAPGFLPSSGAKMDSIVAWAARGRTAVRRVRRSLRILLRASVHGQRGAVDGGGGFRGEEDGDLRDSLGRDPSGALFFAAPLAIRGGVDHAREDGVGDDTGIAILEGDAADEREERGLRSGVRGDAGSGLDGGTAGDGDDAAATGGAHVRE